jgi:hypothetical protein
VLEPLNSAAATAAPINPHNNTAKLAFRMMVSSLGEIIDTTVARS